ncbi:hypothetical protein [Frankia sp. CiP3]|uniref:hypothetical protein n=1 Tax=Frankia sp. CiP3 TaxID=2880971 RepID=UPI001EF69686|nr:hypothetical protein [Frankia sp. CiP3]
MSPMIPGHGCSRRALLGVLPMTAATALAGCSWTRSPREPATTPVTTTTDDTLRRSAVESEQGLLVAYDRAILAYPSVAATLRVVRAHHAEHVSRLMAATTAAPGGPSPAVTVASTPDVATSAPTTMAALLKLERGAAASLRAQCLAASASLAPLLASIHAAETAHGELLAPLVG